MPKIPIDYDHLRENKLTDKEFRLFFIIWSYTKGGHVKVSEYAQFINCSEPTVKRTIKSLEKKGYIEVKYGCYKRLHISISKGSPMIYLKRSPVIPLKITHDLIIDHPRSNQKRINNRINNRIGELPLPFIPEESNPDDFTKTSDEVSALLKKVGLKK